jgi:hypothetical protein
MIIIILSCELTFLVRKFDCFKEPHFHFLFYVKALLCCIKPSLPFSVQFSLLQLRDLYLEDSLGIRFEIRDLN